VDGDHITVLDSEVMANDTVYPCGAIVEVVICEHDQDCVLALLALDKDSVATEELERLHGVVREGDNGVVIVDGIGDTVKVSTLSHPETSEYAYMRELGFFFFLRMAVAISSSCGKSV
jgi:hypothetical protein